MNDEEEELERLVSAVDLVSKKWHPIIIHRLHREEPLRFTELKDRVGEISAKVLTDSLDNLVENDLVSRTVVSESPKRVEYELTKDGRGLHVALSSLAEWGDEYLDPDPDPTVLIIDNDPRLVKMHAGWLEDDYQVKRAYNGSDGLRMLDEDVDVVLLDRRMPGLSGDEILERIRGLNLDCRVVMLSAVNPDFDVVDMAFDAYVMKPTLKDELRDVLTDVLTRDTYGEKTREYVVLNAKRALLDAEKTASELAESDEYTRLIERLEELEAAIDDPSEGIENDDRLLASLQDDE